MVLTQKPGEFKQFDSSYCTAHRGLLTCLRDFTLQLSELGVEPENTTTLLLTGFRSMPDLLSVQVASKP